MPTSKNGTTHALKIWDTLILCCLYYYILSPLSALKRLSRQVLDPLQKLPQMETVLQWHLHKQSWRFILTALNQTYLSHDPLVTRHSLFGCLAHSGRRNIKGPRVVKHPFHPSSSSGHVSPSQDGPPQPQSYLMRVEGDIRTLGFWLKQNLEEKTLQKQLW